jgi:hypothetical protein
MFVPDIVRKCVLFLGARENGKFVPKATTFVVTTEEHGRQFLYLATAEHCVLGFRNRGWDIWVRSNLTAGGTQEDMLSANHWWFHPTKETSPTDVAVAPIYFTAGEDYAFVPLTGPNAISGTSDILQSNGIGTGDEVVVTGLFKSHYGKQRNVPVVRVGNIAAMKGEPVHTHYCGRTEAYLIEARSISGLSGSPVFVQKPFLTRIGPPQIAASIYLLGLMHGHFDVENLNEDMVAGDSAPQSGINTGIGVVIPVEKVIETINHPDLVENRRKWAEEHPLGGPPGVVQ